MRSGSDDGKGKETQGRRGKEWRGKRERERKKEDGQGRGVFGTCSYRLDKQTRMAATEANPQQLRARRGALGACGFYDGVRGAEKSTGCVLGGQRPATGAADAVSAHRAQPWSPGAGSSIRAPSASSWAPGRLFSG